MLTHFLAMTPVDLHLLHILIVLVFEVKSKVRMSLYPFSEEIK